MQSRSLAEDRGAAPESAWPGPFGEAFKRSKNAMVLLDDERRVVEVNQAYLELLGLDRETLLGRPAYEIAAQGPVSPRRWRALLGQREFTGVADLVRSDGGRVRVEFAGYPEVVTGRHMVLFVALRTARIPRTHQIGNDSATAPLSKRELEIIGLIADGRSGPEIAATLHVAHNTVRTHVRNASGKLGARSRAHLVAKALGDGLLRQ